MTGNNYIVPMAKLTCKECGAWDIATTDMLLAGQSSLELPCNCQRRPWLSVYDVEHIINNKYKSTAEYERVEVDFSAISSSPTLVGAWSDGGARAAIISRYARHLYEDQQGGETCTENAETYTRLDDVHKKEAKLCASDSDVPGFGERWKPPTLPAEEDAAAEVKRITTKAAVRKHASDTDVRIIAEYDLRRACEKHGCQLWTEVTYADASTRLTGMRTLIVTRGGRALCVNPGNLQIMVSNGDSVDDMVAAWVAGVK